MGERSSGVLRAAAYVVVTWVVVTGLVLGWGWLITHPLAHEVDGFDNPISRWFAGERTGALNGPADAGTLLGETIVGASVAVLVAIGFAVWRRTWRPLVFVAVLEACIGGLYWLATHLEPRDRPPVRILDPGLVPNHSFPSGHVATAVAAYAGIVVLARAYAGSAWRWTLPAALLPLGVLLARLYQGAHHLTDVATSVVYASVFLLVLARLLLPRHRPGAARREGEARTSVAA